MTGTGHLFVFEGPDGSGKTSLSQALVTLLESNSLPCRWFSFPGQDDGTLGSHIYKLHHDPINVGVQQIQPASLQLLHIAAHVDEIRSRIMPALQSGVHVILDRFWWSTFVYGTLSGVDRYELKSMIDVERHAWGTVRPAAIFLVQRVGMAHQTCGCSHVGNALGEYLKLALQESAASRVCTVENKKDFKTALKAIACEVQAILGYEIKEGPPKRATGLPHQSRQPKRMQEAWKVPAIITRLAPAQPTIVYDTYWRFAAERQAIFFRRLRGESPPWTSDPILREYKFTNAYRASDRVSQYLIRNVIYTGDQSPSEVTFRTLLFKMFNRIETWELLLEHLGEISHRTYDFAKYDRALTSAMARGERIYSAAYIMPSGGPGQGSGRKHRMHLKLINHMLEADLPRQLMAAQTMAKAFEVLRTFPTIGDFLAYQFLTDLNYSDFLNFSEMSFVMPGPGARDGIHKCFTDLGGLNEAEIIKVVAERQACEFERLGVKCESLWGRDLQLIDIQNLFCEVDKYSRMRHPEYAGRTGRTRIKQKFRMTPSAICYWYPPKWGLNELISRGS